MSYKRVRPRRKPISDFYRARAIKNALAAEDTAERLEKDDWQQEQQEIGVDLATGPDQTVLQVLTVDERRAIIGLLPIVLDG